MRKYLTIFPRIGLISFEFFIAVTIIKNSDIRVFFENNVFSVARQT